jgi:hypothetical protein
MVTEFSLVEGYLGTDRKAIEPTINPRTKPDLLKLEAVMSNISNDPEFTYFK